MLDSLTFQTVIESTPLVSIDLCVVRDHQILLGLRNNEPLAGRWFTPGGRLLKNEPWQQGLQRIAQVELGLSLSAEQCQLMGVWDHFYGNSAISEQISTHYVNLPHVWYVQNDIDVATDQQHKAIRWFDLEEVSRSREHHKYMKQYADWVIEDLRRKEED